MANPQHLQILKQGVDSWNIWRAEFKGQPDLSQANLKETNLGGINLFGALLDETDLSFAYLQGANLARTQFKRANLRKANIGHADFSEAVLTGADMRGVNLHGANLRGSNLSGASLNEACLAKVSAPGANFQSAVLIKANLCDAELCSTNLAESNLTSAWMIRTYIDNANLRTANLQNAWMTRATLVNSDLIGADLTGARVFGAAAWNLNLEEARQDDLVITDEDEPVVTVDNLEVAQFVYLLLHNEKIRDAIDTIGEKGVLILGRFTEERKVVLDAIRNRIRELGFVPMMFDFERPTQRDFTETIKTLAGLSRFIIADITNPRSSPLELQATMPDYMIPFVPIIYEGEEPFAMFRDLSQKYGEWVVDILEYDSVTNLVEVLEEAVVRPALELSDQLLLKKAETIRKRHIRDYR